MSEVVLRFQGRDDGLDARFRKVNTQLDAFKAGADRIAGSVAGVFRAAVPIAAAAAVAALTHEALQFADATKKMEAQTGFSNEQVQKLTFFAGQASVEVGTLTSGTLKLQRILGGLEEGSEKSADALKRLGLNAIEFRRLAPEEQFRQVAKEIAGISDQNQRVVATTDLFGKSGGELLPVLVAIGEEANKLEAKFDSIGGAVGQKTIDIVDDLGDELTTTSLAAKSLGTELLGLIAPPLIAGLQQLQHVLTGFRVLAGGGGNEIVNLDKQIDQLEANMRAELALAGRAGARADEVRAAITARFEAQIAELKRMQDIQLGLGEAGAFKTTPFPKLAMPDLLTASQFEETDAQRKEREDLESVRARQRLAAIATNQEIERDMAFKHQLELEGISRDSLERQIKLVTDKTLREQRIFSDSELFLAQVRQTFGIQQIKLEEIKSQSILQIAATMFGQLAAQNTKLAKIQQGIALAQTIWSTASGIMKAFETLPWPASIVAAAKVAITGAIQVAKIKSTNYSAGSVSGSAPTLAGGGSVSGGTTTNQPPDGSQVVSATGATTVYISGVVTREVIDQLMNGLRDGFNRDVIIIPSSSAQAQAIRGAA